MTKMEKKTDPYELQFSPKGNPELIARNKALMESRKNRWKFVRAEEVRNQLNLSFQEIAREEAAKLVDYDPFVMVYGIKETGERTWIKESEETEQFEMFGLL